MPALILSASVVSAASSITNRNKEYREPKIESVIDKQQKQDVISVFGKEKTYKVKNEQKLQQASFLPCSNNEFDFKLVLLAAIIGAPMLAEGVKFTFKKIFDQVDKFVGRTPPDNNNILKEHSL